MRYADLPEEKKEKARAAAREWNRMNKERHRANSRKWASENPDAITAQNRRQYLRTRGDNKAKKLYYNAVKRALARGLELTITAEDIVIPDVCPIYSRPFEEVGDYAPSLDRIDPNVGYTPENIAVISVRANRIKNDGTAEEHRLIADWMEGR